MSDTTLGFQLDLAGSDRRLIGEAGLEPAGWREEYPELIGALTDPAPGYTRLPDQSPEELTRFAAEWAGRVDDLLLLGIGGLGLGARMLSDALVAPAERREGHPRLHVLDNVDPRLPRRLLATLDPARTLALVITKSGSTAETLAVFALVRDWLRRSLGEDHRRRIAVVTDPEKGDLRRLARAEGYAAFDVPPEVGGRFSVLCPVGLLPAALLGLDVPALLGGAAAMRRATLAPAWRKNPALALALALHAHHEAGRRIVGVMPYADGLREFARWFAQLWAESLGKRQRAGGLPPYGPTPQPALGVTDQHSQLQLYVEGPRDKVIWLMEVRDLGPDLTIPPQTADYPSLAYLGGHTLGGLLAAELAGTASALAEAGTPSLTLSLPSLAERELGALIYLCEAATSLAGRLAGVNAYDQPGVEAGKLSAYARLGREGYTDRLRVEEELLRRRPAGLVSRA